MNNGLWIARKNYLCSLIKKVSDAYEGEDINFLKEHCRQVIESHPDDKIEDAILCYQEMIKQANTHLWSKNNDQYKREKG